MRTATTLLLSVCSTLVFATLPPNTTATLADHLREVNGQWRVQDPQPIDAQDLASFRVDAERIAKHLHMVSDRLSHRSGEGFSAQQSRARLDLLGRLHTYADGGTFPQNHVLPYRNPVFIDPHGTACAVGWLMIESGRRDLAERISAEMNLAYVLDMPASPLWPEIAAWADEHGFTAEELAWIQPAYQPPFDWIPMGGGTNGTVTVARRLNNGDVFLAGEFTDAGGTAVSRAAIWNGTSYVPMGAGLQGQVNCAVEFGGELYVGGALLNGWSDLAKWDGSYWSFSTVFDGKYPYISALHEHEGELYAAGAMSGFAGTTEFVQKFNGTNWQPIGSAFNAPVLALASHNGTLIAGGAFTTIVTPSLPPPVLHVAELEGNEWGQLADGLDATVRTLLDFNGTLYAGGELYANVAPTFGLARIEAGAPQWEPLLPNHDSYMASGNGPTYISSLVARANDEIYFGGSFNIAQLVGTYGNNLARFFGTPDAVAAMIIVDEAVNAVTIADDQLIAGGAFMSAFPYVVSLDLTTGVDGPAQAAFTLSPNPAADIVRIFSADGAAISGKIAITDASGRAVAAPVQRGTGSVTVDVHELPAGAYQVTVGDGNVIGTQRLVKQ